MRACLPCSALALPSQGVAHTPSQQHPVCRALVSQPFPLSRPAGVLRSHLQTACGRQICFTERTQTQTPWLMLPLPATTAKRPSFTRLEYLVAYILASLIATFLITFLFTRTEYKFPFPYVVDCIQLGITWLASTRITSAPAVPAKALAPVTLAYVGWLAVNPLFLINVPITRYQSFTALALPFSLALAYPILANRPTPGALITCFVYCAGLWISAEGASSWTGAFLGLANAFFVASFAVLAKKCLATVDPW